MNEFAIPLTVGEVDLRVLRLEDIEQLRDAVERSRESLEAWIPHLTAVTDAEEHVRIKLKQVEVGRAIEWGLWSGEAFLGCAGIYDIQQANAAVEIGYWLTPEARGRGLATRASERLTEHAFTTMKMHRVTIKCMLHNLASRAVPVRMGMIEEAIIREAWKVNDEYVDHVIYRFLEPEWRAGMLGG